MKWSRMYSVFQIQTLQSHGFRTNIEGAIFMIIRTLIHVHIYQGTGNQPIT